MSPRFVVPIAIAVLAAAAPPALADQVIADDLIVQGGLCAGLSCVNGEDFSADIAQIKDDNVRMKFEDTSSGGGFPTNDWRFTFNDTGSGGSNYFGLDDLTGSKTPFKVMAGAPTGAMHLSAVGDFGLGTSSPNFDLHINRTDTPGIRLEQTNLGGFTAQTWDVAGNEANFFVRDLTAGSRLPFRIRPGAPTSSIDIAASGNVGIGTQAPTQALTVARADGTSQLRVEETSNTETARVLADLVNKGAPQLRFSNTVVGATSWLAGPSPAAFVLKSTAGSAPTALSVSASGEATSAGVLQQGADPAAQENVMTADPAAILVAIRSLPLRRFEYTADGSDAKHLAPGGAAFRAALNVGGADDAIAPGDIATAALAGVQALADLQTSEGAVGKIAALSASVKELTGTLDGTSRSVVLLSAANARLQKKVASLAKSNLSLGKRLRKLERKVAAL